MKFEWLINEAFGKARGIEYNTFATSLKLPEKVVREEENGFRGEGIVGKEALKTKLSREIREQLEKMSGKKMNLDGDVTFKFDLERMAADVDINPLFLLCKYRKLARGYSQTRWDKYNSVEKYVVKAAKELYGCSNAFLHGSGREDVDVRMLGDGRICTVEIVEPKRRNADVKELEKRVNELSGKNVELTVIRQVRKEYVWIVKEAHFDKEYEAEVEFEKDADETMLKKIMEISELEQQTPIRVGHRRANLVRKKNVLGMEVMGRQGNRAKFRIRAEAGTYIKELISGDGGRTRPSFASVAGCGARCVALDVIKVHEYISDWW